MQRVKQTLLGPPTLSFRQACILPLICCIYVSWIPSRGFILIISESQNVNYLSDTFITYSIAFAAGCLINSILIDKLGAKLSLLVSSFLLLISLCSFAWITTYNDIDIQINYVILSINAFASSMAFPAIAKFIYTYFYPAQYDIVFIVIALCAHLSSFTTPIGIESLANASMDTLLRTGCVSIVGIVLFIVLCVILRQDTDEKWYLSPLTVYDASINEYDDEFCQKQITLKACSNKKSDDVQQQELEDAHFKEDSVDVTLQNRTLAAELKDYMQQQPSCQRHHAFIMIYALIITSMCNLSVMNCLNVFSLEMVQDLLPGLNTSYPHPTIHEQVLGSNGNISSMIQTGMILALFIALFYRYYAMNAVYTHYKCSSVLVKLLVTLSVILCVMIWAIEYATVHPDTSIACLFLFDALLIVYGVCISYPIHVFCYVFLLSVSGYNSGFVFSVLELMMFVVSSLSAVAGTKIGETVGWHWLSLLFVMMSVPTMYCYSKLSELQSTLNMLQTRKFFMKNKSLLQPKGVPFDEMMFSTEDTYTMIRMRCLNLIWILMLIDRLKELLYFCFVLKFLSLSLRYIDINCNMI
eukprot:300411_1